jgi:hypothetical protein
MIIETISGIASSLCGGEGCYALPETSRCALAGRAAPTFWLRLSQDQGLTPRDDEPVRPALIRLLEGVS